VPLTRWFAIRPTSCWRNIGRSATWMPARIFQHSYTERRRTLRQRRYREGRNTFPAKQIRSGNHRVFPEQSETAGNRNTVDTNSRSPFTWSENELRPYVTPWSSCYQIILNHFSKRIWKGFIPKNHLNVDPLALRTCLKGFETHFGWWTKTSTKLWALQICALFYSEIERLETTVSCKAFSIIALWW